MAKSGMSCLHVRSAANRTRGATYLHLNLARRQSIVDPTGASPRVAMLERADPDIAIARRRRAYTRLMALSGLLRIRAMLTPQHHLLTGLYSKN
jgi:hypothetical protein